MSGSAGKRKHILRDPVLGSATRNALKGNIAKRGSFDGLVAEIEREQIANGQKPTISSAAFRAGAIIRMLRKSRGLSQSMLAKNIGVSQARISELEAGMGTHGPSWDLMERIAKACDATILVSPGESDIAVDVSEPSKERHWTLAAAGN